MFDQDLATTILLFHSEEELDDNSTCIWISTGFQEGKQQVNLVPVPNVQIVVFDKGLFILTEL